MNTHLFSYKSVHKICDIHVTGVIQYDENGNPVPIAETRQRAEELFDVSENIDENCMV